MRAFATLIGPVTILAGCQGYEFVFQPDADRQGTHLRFAVEQPSEADILFVIDNSGSMSEEQTALQESFDRLLEVLAPQDTRYRIGIVSTDALGWDEDCTGTQLDEAHRPGAKGNCAAPTVLLRRPHDGALGRLIAAFDPDFFDTTQPMFDALSAEQKTAIAKILPTDLITHPPEFQAFDGPKGEEGARWVIDRETIRLEACQACDCTTGSASDMACNEEDTCFSTCAEAIAPKAVEAYFRANIAGLGLNGRGWEEGLKSASLAVGIDPTDEDPDTAIAPADDLTRVPDGPNTFTAGAALVPWVRREALLAVMFVTDEEDCSMQPALWRERCEYEEGCGAGWVMPPGWVQQPIGSMCYQAAAQPFLLRPPTLASLLVRKKDDSLARVAVGVIGGVQKIGTPPLEAREGEAVDCAVGSGGVPTNVCSCLEGVDPASQDCDWWCQFTLNKEGFCVAPPDPPNLPYCDAMAGSRYVRFANLFRRRTYESVCLAEGGVGFGEAMADFARIATLACFDLEQGVRPAGNSPENIRVRRAAKQDADAGIAPSLLPMQDADSLDAGWYYLASENRICLTGLDRLIGDVYDIFVLHRDKPQ